jgi:hypothetical protein
MTSLTMPLSYDQQKALEAGWADAHADLDAWSLWCRREHLRQQYGTDWVYLQCIPYRIDPTLTQHAGRRRAAHEALVALRDECVGAGDRERFVREAAGSHWDTGRAIPVRVWHSVHRVPDDQIDAWWRGQRGHTVDELIAAWAEYAALDAQYRHYQASFVDIHNANWCRFVAAVEHIETGEAWLTEEPGPYCGALSRYQTPIEYREVSHG